LNCREISHFHARIAPPISSAQPHGPIAFATVNIVTFATAARAAVFAPAYAPPNPSKSADPAVAMLAQATCPFIEQYIATPLKKNSGPVIMVANSKRSSTAHHIPSFFTCMIIPIVLNKQDLKILKKIDKRKKKKIRCLGDI
jgi:hypothetical protein